MKKVKELLKGKGRELWSIGPDDSVYNGIAMMADKNVGALLVMEDARLVGVISERDYSRKVILEGRASKETRVSEIMATEVVYVEPDETVEECMALMTDKHIRYLPVMDGEELLGIVSIGDLVKAVIAEQQFVIEQLEHYISGAR
jgi:CBS domain-containing protein